MGQVMCPQLRYVLCLLDPHTHAHACTHPCSAFTNLHTCKYANTPLHTSPLTGAPDMFTALLPLSLDLWDASITPLTSLSSS